MASFSANMAAGAADEHRGRFLPLALVLGAMSFNLALCFVSTKLTTVTNLHVIACEVLTVSIVMMLVWRRIEPRHVILIGSVVLFVLAIALIRIVLATDHTVDVKIIRDFLIPIAFFLLGAQFGDVRLADLMVKIAAGLVLLFALFEYFAVDVFTQFFNVAKYYVGRGTMDAREALQSADLFISGIRPAGLEGGRNLLPFLGDHRVSSIFLEPVSMGNFGILVFIWGLTRSKAEQSVQWSLLAGGLIFVVFADSRFGAYFCLISLAISLMPTRLTTLGIGILPLVMMAVLLLVPLIVTGSYDPQRRYIDNGFVGRLVLSAQILGEFDFLGWLGLKPLTITSFDSGYSYVIASVGVLGGAIAWWLLFAIRGPDDQFYIFRNFAAAYYAVILCVSNSPFTIKTASLLWFLVGSLAANRAASARFLSVGTPAPACRFDKALMPARLRRIQPESSSGMQRPNAVKR